jgi:hypothetical protein
MFLSLISLGLARMACLGSGHVSEAGVLIEADWKSGASRRTERHRPLLVVTSPRWYGCNHALVEKTDRSRCSRPDIILMLLEIGEKARVPGKLESYPVFVV